MKLQHVALLCVALGIFNAISLFVKPMCATIGEEGESGERGHEPPSDNDMVEHWGNKELTLEEFIADAKKTFNLDVTDDPGTDYDCLIRKFGDTKYTFLALNEALNRAKKDGSCEHSKEDEEEENHPFECLPGASNINQLGCMMVSEDQKQIFGNCSFTLRSYILELRREFGLDYTKHPLLDTACLEKKYPEKHGVCDWNEILSRESVSGPCAKMPRNFSDPAEPAKQVEAVVKSMFDGGKLTFEQFETRIRQINSGFTSPPDLVRNCLIKEFGSKSFTYGEFKDKMLDASSGICATSGGGRRRLREISIRVCASTWQADALYRFDVDVALKFMFVVALGLAAAQTIIGCCMLMLASAKHTHLSKCAAFVSFAQCAFVIALVARLGTKYDAFGEFGPGLGMLFASLIADLNVAALMLGSTPTTEKNASFKKQHPQSIAMTQSIAVTQPAKTPAAPVPASHYLSYYK